ncbi:carboxylating nicotinate-nucleotide diphosphorylase [Helicobacter sp. 13S00477-4]|uniref:carboxylating nicotinate-nucleotide diphosphorylase n=1 Tax=Helicobacter sp. 13S00477-4 TaxID=1905759 RepID=UPI000BA623F0|nr:carboxylating nicotinate-nucleotide diphosphorylase [Helicobacter sp. 13S00477-4]PAF52126.1 nicotinate-nucleotide diphosphorylase (carboxylating) [Helicobacter sp. 13S00477-4]
MSENIGHFIHEVLKEDLGRGDLFERLVKKDFSVKAVIVAKDKGVFSGEIYAKEICRIFDIKYKILIKDAQIFKEGEVLFELEGDYTKLLKIERTLLNILQHSCGIATNTATYVKELENIDIAILDTRKTRPLLRNFEKYSVRNGGAKNHRMGLDDTLMLKDTHLKYIQESDLKSFIKLARKNIPWTAKIEIECEDVLFAKTAMCSGADIIMCDNMEVRDIKEVVAFRDEYYPNVLLEGSGRITKEKALIYAQSGVDAISIGSLIHQAVWLDLSMKML